MSGECQQHLQTITRLAVGFESNFHPVCRETGACGKALVDHVFRSLPTSMEIASLNQPLAKMAPDRRGKRQLTGFFKEVPNAR
jgi:hypothetical protein